MTERLRSVMFYFLSSMLSSYGGFTYFLPFHRTPSSSQQKIIHVSLSE